MAIRLNEQQRTKLISIVLQDNSTTWEDVGDNDSDTDKQSTSKDAPQRALPVTLGKNPAMS